MGIYHTLLVCLRISIAASFLCRNPLPIFFKRQPFDPSNLSHRSQYSVGLIWYLRASRLHIYLSGSFHSRSLSPSSSGFHFWTIFSIGFWSFPWGTHRSRLWQSLSTQTPQWWARKQSIIKWSSTKEARRTLEGRWTTINSRTRPKCQWLVVMDLARNLLSWKCKSISGRCTKKYQGLKELESVSSKCCWMF